MTAAEQSRPKDGRRWFQYSLKSLFVLTTIIAVSMGWWSQRVRPQRDAAAALTKAGANVRYDFQMHNLRRPPYWPTWLVDALGVDYFASVQEVYLHDTQVTDTGLKQLKRLTSLEYLDLSGTQVTDAGLEHLKGLTTLNGLSLGDTHVTEVGLAHLKGLTGLRQLSLDGTKVTAAGLEHLKGVTSLEWLYLNNTNVTDTELEHLRGLTVLREVSLTNTQITDGGMARLKQSLPNCRIHY